MHVFYYSRKLCALMPDDTQSKFKAMYHTFTVNSPFLSVVVKRANKINGEGSKGSFGNPDPLCIFHLLKKRISGRKNFWLRHGRRLWIMPCKALACHS